MVDKITLEDIKKAVDKINEEKQPLKVIRFKGGGWIEADIVGNPIKIGLGKEQMKEIRRLCEDLGVRQATPVGVVKILYGVPVVETEVD